MQQSGTVGNNVKQANERRNLVKDSIERRNSEDPRGGFLLTYYSPTTHSVAVSVCSAVES